MSRGPERLFAVELFCCGAYGLLYDSITPMHWIARRYRREQLALHPKKRFRVIGFKRTTLKKGFNYDGF